MQAKLPLRTLVASVTLALCSNAVFAMSVTEAANRNAAVNEILQTWQQRILAERTAVPDAANWAVRTAPKLAQLTDVQLEMAKRATSVGELELLFVTAPIANGTSLADLAASTPGNITIMPPRSATAGNHTKTNPTANPSAYSDMVFTAVTPCRIYDSRFSTSPINGTPGAAWPANTARIIDVGPETNYAFQGGQATACAGSVPSADPIGAAMTAVSTVNQGGAGYLVFYSDGAANPNPYGVAQWFQPGYVQTSFVVMPTDQIPPTYSDGYAGNASTHVIVDLIGYFTKSKVNLFAVVNSDGTFARGFHSSSSSSLGTGSYQVDFDRDVSLCSYSATIGTATAGAAPAGNIAVSPRSGFVNSVFVATYNSAGTLTNEPFHLKVTCQ